LALMRSLDAVAMAFAASVVYAAGGNAIIARMLLRRGIPFRSVWAGTPFYLYGVCARMTPTDRGLRGLRAFALSTDAAFVLAFALCAWLMFLSP
jgi:hypothetical protein